MNYNFWIDFYDESASEYEKRAFEEEMEMFNRKKNGEEIPLEMIYWVIMYNKYARDSRNDAARMKKKAAKERKEMHRRIIMLFVFIAVAVMMFFIFGALYGILAVSIMITVYVIYVYCRDMLDGLI